MSNKEVNQEHIEAIEEALDYALDSCVCASKASIADTILGVLDKARREGRLNSAERRVACEHIKINYGYDF